jgi:hypothetical protein
VLRSLGVQRVRLTVKWSTLAPSPLASSRPAGFDAADPAAYPPDAWLPYDRVLRLAAANRIKVDLNLTAPGPVWAMRRGAPDAKTADHYAPNVHEWERFVRAVGKRYSGHYKGLPRVDYWSIWNEANQPGWLAPQRQEAGGRLVLYSPRLYRAYAEAAFRALAATRHSVATDTVLVGELAPEGLGAGLESPVPPMPFLRALYCVGDDYRPLEGRAAGVLGCPRNGNTRGFVSAHHALFQATGFAHHPYYFTLAPDRISDNVDFAPLSNLSRLEGGLDRIFRAYGVGRQIPIFITEYGYETNPPDPYRIVSPTQQAEYLNDADYIAWQDPRVRSVAQFLLFDAPPDNKYLPHSFKYWDTFQTGLLYADGKPKPSFAAYRIPIWLPSRTVAHGAPLSLWGWVRPDLAARRAEIQWRPRGGKYRTIATVTAPSGSPFTTRVSPPGTGFVRIAWGMHASRGVGVTVS